MPVEQLIERRVSVKDLVEPAAEKPFNILGELTARDRRWVIDSLRRRISERVADPLSNDTLSLLSVFTLFGEDIKSIDKDDYWVKLRENLETEIVTIFPESRYYLLEIMMQVKILFPEKLEESKRLVGSGRIRRVEEWIYEQEAGLGLATSLAFFKILFPRALSPDQLKHYWDKFKPDLEKHSKEFHPGILKIIFPKNFPGVRASKSVLGDLRELKAKGKWDAYVQLAFGTAVMNSDVYITENGLKLVPIEEPIMRKNPVLPERRAF